MSEQVSAHFWNRQIVTLVQSMIGSISSNFRMVTIVYNNNDWHITFYLETTSQEDEEEIEDIMFEFEVLQDSSMNFSFSTIITNDILKLLKPPAFTVFKRREHF